MIKYPLPKPDNLFATFAGNHKFMKLNLMQASQSSPRRHNDFTLFVVQGNGPSLLGRSWVNWRALGIATVQKVALLPGHPEVPSLPAADNLLHTSIYIYAAVFDDGLMQSFKATVKWC